MSVMTVRLAENKHARLRTLAKARGVSLNRLMDELATAALSQYDAEIRFRKRTSAGSPKRGLLLLDKLDSVFSASDS